MGDDLSKATKARVKKKQKQRKPYGELRLGRLGLCRRLLQLQFCLCNALVCFLQVSLQVPEWDTMIMMIVNELRCER